VGLEDGEDGGKEEAFVSLPCAFLTLAVITDWSLTCALYVTASSASINIPAIIY